VESTVEIISARARPRVSSTNAQLLGNRASFRQRGNLFVQDDPVGELNVETRHASLSRIRARTCPLRTG